VNEARELIEGVPSERAIIIPGLQAPAEVIFTEMDVPHVFAESEADAGRALGYVLARDRFFTMDIVRRLGQGTISGLFGSLGLSSDLESRGLGMSMVAQRLHERTSEGALAYLQAVCDGINAYIEAVEVGEERAPMEYTLAGALFRTTPLELMKPWSTLDISAMAAVILFQTNFETKDLDYTQRLLQIAELYEGDPERAELFTQEVALNHTPMVEASSARPSDSWGQGSAVSQGKADGESVRSSAVAELGTQLRARVGAIKSSLSMVQRLRERLKPLSKWFGRDHQLGFGSNAWAVGAQHTGGGSVIAGDGHLALSIPSVMYQVGLNTEALGGEGGLNQAGLLITSIPVMAVGTNGDIAWSQVNPYFDITDWYEELLELGEDGRPARSASTDEAGGRVWRDLQTEAHSIQAPAREALDSPELDLNYVVYLTFDGRRIMEIEGRSVSLEEANTPNSGAVNVLTGWVIPEDQNGDGVISAISVDHGAYDASGFIDSLFGAGRAQTVEEYQAQSRRYLGGGLFSAVGDQSGSVLYTSYQSMPCRAYLDRDSDGTWGVGSAPNALIDGARFGGFTLPSDERGFVDESAFDPSGAHSDPYRCVVPADQMPEALNPPEGYVVTANNEPLPFGRDGRVDNDPWYLGGPWANERAYLIARHIDRLVAEGEVGVTEMAEVQANDESLMGERFAPHFITALERATLWQAQLIDGELLNEGQQRAVALWSEARAQMEEAQGYLTRWASRGFHARSGVETFYHPNVTEEEASDAVATMIFNSALRYLLTLVWEDEAEQSIPMDGTRRQVYALERMLRDRGSERAVGLESWREATQESLFFDDVRTDDQVELSDELMIKALAMAFEELSAEPSEPGVGGFGTDDMSAWRWGLRHMGRFESILAPFLGDEGPVAALISQFSVTTSRLPLAEGLEEGDPREGLKHFPRPGDQWGVDAANPGFSGDYTFTNGPVMRMVIELKDGAVSGQNIVPGGQSGSTSSPHFDDQLGLWLANDALPLRYEVHEVVQGATRRWSFVGSEE